MLPDRSLTFFERMKYHRRFYIPAAICLFLSYPGSLAALLPSSSLHLTLAQRIEMMLLYVPTVIAYTLILICALPREIKTLLGVIAYIIPLALTILTLRTTVFSINFYQAVLRTDVWLQFLSGFLLFILLCIMDQKKRARSIFWSLCFLTIPLGIFLGMNKKAVGFLDYVRYHDIADRVGARDGWNEEMNEQCDLISVEELRAKCHAVLHVNFGGGMACDESDSDCAIARGEHVRKTLSGHPAPKEPNLAPVQAATP